MKITRNGEEAYRYTGEEAPESAELIGKIRHLSPEAQSVLYALLIEEGENTPSKREGVGAREVQEACAACSLDDAPTQKRLIEAGVSELERRGFIDVRDERLYLKTRTEHMRTFERAVESSKYVVRR